MYTNDFGKARRVSLCAMMVAVAVVVDLFGYDFVIGGATAKHITFGGSFLAFAAYAGGPIYAAIAYGLKDIISCILRPNGAYNPWFTVVALFKGAAIGAMWLAAKRVRFSRAALYMAAAAFAVMALGFTNLLVAEFVPNTSYAALLLRFGNNRDLLSIGLIIAGLICLLGGAVLYAVRGQLKGAADSYSRCLFVMMAPSVAASIFNTIVLKLSYYQGTPIAVLMIPRLSIELIFTTVNAYVLVVLFASAGRVAAVIGGAARR